MRVVISGCCSCRRSRFSEVPVVVFDRVGRIGQGGAKDMKWVLLAENAGVFRVGREHGEVGANVEEYLADVVVPLEEDMVGFSDDVD